VCVFHLLRGHHRHLRRNRANHFPHGLGCAQDGPELAAADLSGGVSQDRILRRAGGARAVHPTRHQRPLGTGSRVAGGVVSSSALVHQFDVAALPLLEPRDWRDALSMRFQLGERLLALYGQRTAEIVTITAVVQAPDNGVGIQRTRTSVDAGYSALTPHWPALACFERELHEQTGVSIPGHPWLKPIRFEGQEQSAMNAYPYYRVE